MDDYSKHIEILAQSGESIIFQNSSREHASIVMATIFKHSNENVKILAGNLCGDVSSNDQYNKELKSFLDRNGKLSILLDNFNDTDKINSKTLQILKDALNFNPNSVKIKKTEPTILQSKNQKIHFTVGDNKMFRLEEDTDNYFAKCSFNEPEFTKTLSTFFDSLFLLSTKSVLIQ